MAVALAALNPAPGVPAARARYHSLVPLRSRSRDDDAPAGAGAGSPGKGGRPAAQDKGGRGAAAARPAPRGKEQPKAEKRSMRERMRDAPAKFIGRTPWLRRRYAKAMLKSIAKRRKKGKPLSEEMQLLERQLRGLTPSQRMKALETVMEQGAARESSTNRAARRAAGRPQRQSGRGKGHRPGLPAGVQRPRER